MNLVTADSSTFHAFFNSSPDGIIMLDLDTQTVSQCNTAAEQMFRGKSKAIIGLTLEDISAEFQPCGTSSTALAKEKISAVLKSGGIRFEWHCKRLDSEGFFCDVSFSALKQGSKTFLICALRDISHLKKRVEDLENLNDQFDLVIKGSDVGIWQWDLVTGELIWSEPLFRLIGYDPQALCPSFTFWEQIIHPDDLSRVMCALKDHLENHKPYAIELRNKCKNGDYKWFKVSGFAKRNDAGEPIKMAGSMDDINQRKEAELANKRLLELLDASSDFIGQADSNKNLTYLNPAFKNLVGYGQKGRNDISDWHPAEDLQKLDEVIFPLTLKNGSWRGEVNLLDIEGNIIPCSLLELGHKNSKGEFETFSAIFRDISDLKQKEAELLKQTKISEHQSKLAAIGQLAAGVGHEINNPLAIAKGYIESSLNTLIAHEDLEQATLINRLEKVNVAIDRISKITNGLRRFARNDIENAEYCALGDIIYEAYGLVQEIYSNDGIHLSIENLKVVDDTFVYVDKGKLQQVLMNILGNARDAVENSSIKDIQLDLKKQDGMVIIEVKDSGVGIPDSIAERIFDPFFTTKDVNKGTGLGLSFVREYVEEMKGTIKVSSIDGESTTLTIALPEAARQTIQKNEKVIKPFATDSVRLLNILVVEDEESLCEFYCELLKSIGHEVETSYNGKEALAKLINSPQKFDLVVSDMQMPVMGGIELAKEIQKNNTIKQPKFLLTTGA